MNYHFSGSAELDRAIGERHRIRAAWGMEDGGCRSSMRPIIRRSGGEDHFVGVNKMVVNDADPILVNFKTRTITRGGVRVRCGRLAFRLMAALLAAKGPLTSRELCNHLFDDCPYGGALYDGETVRGYIHRARHGYWTRRYFVRPILSRLELRIVADSTKGYRIARD